MTVTDSSRADGPAHCSPYSPVQQRVIDLLGRGAGEAPAWPDDLADDLRDHLDQRLGPVARSLPGTEALWVGKSHLAGFAACPRRWAEQRARPFEWTVASIRGVVVHKAIELSVNWRGPAAPADMVDAATTALIDDPHTRAGSFLRSLSTVERAELRAAAVAQTTAFEECFPPVRARWRPVVEGPVRARLARGRIVLAGRPDLTLGTPSAGKVIIDLKTGSEARHHVDDLRFYALVETLRIGIPPRRVATVYLDAGRTVAESVTVDVLDAAAERVIRSVAGMAEVLRGSKPAEQAGGLCRFCPALADCETGIAALADEAWR